MGADTAVIFSNSGFTEPAYRKAMRVGISLAVALKAGDPRIRIGLVRDFYARHQSVNTWNIMLFWSKERQGPDHFLPRQVQLQGKPVMNWISEKSMLLLEKYLDSNRIRTEYAFHREVEFEICGKTCLLTGLAVLLECASSWLRHTIPEDVSIGLYDFLQHRVIVPDKQAWAVGPFDNQAWVEVLTSPEETDLEPGSFKLDLTLYRPVPLIEGVEAPNIDDLIAEHSVTIQKEPVDQA